ASASHTTVLAGAAAQTVSFNNPAVSGGSTFGNLAIERAGTSVGISLQSNIYVAGNILDTTTNAALTDSIYGAGLTVTANGLSLGSRFVMNNAALVTNSGTLNTTGLTFNNMSPTTTQWQMNLPSGASPSLSGISFTT